jgi:hypothetical protein
LRCNWEQDSLKFWKSLFLFSWLRKNIVFFVNKVRWTVVETPGPKGFLANSFERGCGTNRGVSERLCLIVFIPSSLTQIQIWVDLPIIPLLHCWIEFNHSRDEQIVFSVNISRLDGETCN